MAKLDFPSSPTFNQRYPDPAVPGVPVYTWDLEKWVASGPVASPTPAPFDAMAYSGMQINGGMAVDQAASSSGNGYALDGWLVESGGSQVMSGFQAGSAQPTALPGFPKCFQVYPSTANASPAAGSLVVMTQRIEGYRISRLAWGTASAQPITIGFWVNTRRAGAYSGSVKNGSSGRSYAFSFTVNVINTWEWKTVTVPGDTSGTWPTDNTVGMILHFCLMAGTTYQTAANVWTAGNFLGATGTINGVASTGDAFFLTGVTVLPGTQAPTAAQSPNIMRPYDQELVTCMRYFWYWNGTVNGNYPRIGVGYTDTSTSGHFAVYIPTLLRATPTVTFANLAVQGGNITTLSLGSILTNVVHLAYGGTALALGGTQVYGNTTTGWLKLDARL